jgi:ribosomal protein L37AE/L43A
MSVIGSSVAATMMVGLYRCPHCGVEQQRVKPEANTSMECQNCLRSFEPGEAEVKSNLMADRKS